MGMMIDEDIIKCFKSKIKDYGKDYAFSQEEVLNILERYEIKYAKSTIEDKGTAIRCKDCLFFEQDSMYVDGIIESAGTHGTCNAWNRSKTSEEGYCHLAALKPEKMTIDKAIEALSKEAFVITKNLTEWTAARDLLVDTARKYQKIEEQVEWSDKENHKIDATRMIQIKEILQNQGGRLSKIKE